MYIPVMRFPDHPSGIISLSGPETPIGNAEFGGRLRGTTGTGFGQYRVYGMYALVFLIDGGGRYRDRRGVDRRLVPGDLLVVFPEHPHQYGPEAGDDWDEVFIAFQGAAFDGWRSHGLDPAHPVWRPPGAGRWAQRFFALLRQPAATLAQATDLAAEVHGLVADLVASRPSAPADRFEKARRELAGGADAPGLAEVAAGAGMSLERFRKAFKAATGESPAVFRRRRRLEQAALMLQRPDLKLDLIARSLGFYDAFHLSKAFKAETGESPDAFRRRLVHRAGAKS